jgi:predicted AAA+ superfamily ATPase
MFKRPQFQLIKKRIVEERRFIQVISGPRQVGKTTLVQQVLDDLSFPGYYISADGLANAGAAWLQEQWEVARIRWKESTAQEFLLIIDEIQKVNNWSETVKKEWDRDSFTRTPIKVILSGSSRLLLQQGLTESLAGRFESIYISHWTFREMNAAFGWSHEQYCWFGGYPGSAGFIGDEERWKKYISDSIIETSISRDILMLTRVDKPALMRRLFELGCIYSGQILSFTKILGQLLDAGNTTTLSLYLHLLDQAGLLAGLEKYTPERIRQRSSSPKFQVHNMALHNAQSNYTFSSITLQPEKWGRIVESAIGAHLLNSSLTDGFRLHYWRHRNDEIDFVMEKRGQLVGLEIKSGSHQKSSGMKAFQSQFKPGKLMLVGDSGLPWQEFLQLDPAQLF